MITVKLLESTRQKARMIHALTGRHIYEVVDELVSNELERLRFDSLDGGQDGPQSDGLRFEGMEKTAR
jgi:hypothetical protein